MVIGSVVLSEYDPNEGFPTATLKVSRESGIENARDRVGQLVGAHDADVLFEAIEKGIPIVIYERNTPKPIDGDLYRALKALGAKEVYNYDLVMEREGKMRGVFCAVFNVD